MNTFDLEKKLKNIVSTKAATNALFKYLKDNSNILLEMNKQQLFENSEDTNSKPLGFYSSAEENKILKRDGSPFTMVDTGLFKKGMRVDVYYRHLTIRSVYHTYEMLQNENFLSYDWFGLTESNYEKLKKNYTLPFLIKWLEQEMKG